MQNDDLEQNPKASTIKLVIGDAKAYLGHEVITIVNQGEVKQSLTGWCIATLDGLFVFRIPMGITLIPGDHLHVACGPQKSILRGYDLIWKRFKRLNANWDVILLINPAGQVVDHYPYGKLAASGFRQVSSINHGEVELSGHSYS